MVAYPPAPQGAAVDRTRLTGPLAFLFPGLLFLGPFFAAFLPLASIAR